MPAHSSGPVGTLRGRPYRGKRLVDLALLCAVILPASALGAVCALAVGITSRGPVFFRQSRIGRDGVPFEVVKFRTMTHGDNPIFPDADRITPVGRVLRRLSLDELPQLINVAAGEMSVVGPRPTLPYQVERYTHRQRGRLAVRPGLTGLAQVNGRNAIPWSERIEWDLAYVDRQSALLDIRLLAATAATVLSGHGAEGHPTDDPLAGELSGDQLSGDQVSGDQVSGDQVSGDQVSGDQVSGEERVG